MTAQVTGWSSELTKVSAFFYRNWRMTHRNVFTVFEVVFWPVVSLLSVGLMTTFLGVGTQAAVFVLTGTLALSIVQVCQLDMAYAVLFEMWSKSVKHQFLAPIRPWHIALGAWLMGLVRGVAVFALMAAVSYWAFGVNFLAAGWGPAARAPRMVARGAAPPVATDCRAAPSPPGARARCPPGAARRA